MNGAFFIVTSEEKMVIVSVDTMNLEFNANIALLVGAEALALMAAKAGVNPSEIIEAIAADPEGNPARYFADLVQAGMSEVPKLLAS